MKIVLFANTDWYLYNFRRSFAQALRERGHDVLLLSPSGPYGEKLREIGLRWQPVPLSRRSLNPLRELKLVGHLFRIFRREGVQLVHGFTIKCAVYGALAARFAGVPGRVNAVVGLGYVFTSSDLLARVLRPLVSRLFRLALGGKGARLILQNPDDVAMFERAKLVDPGSIRLIGGSGVDCERFSPPDSRGPGPVRVLLPARLLWDKGLREYSEAARLLRDWAVPVELSLAGEPDAGNPASVPREVIDRWVSEGLLHWLGHVDDMPTLLKSTDVVVLPSYREGLPKGLIEAAACGCALVATDVPGCREVVSDGIDGLLVPSRDSVALAGAIRLLVEDVELRGRLAGAARSKALAQFDEKLVIAKTVEVYGELIAA